MPRAVSIHIGVNTSQGRMADYRLQNSESLAWKMAGLAEQAGYESMLVLRGPEATRGAVHDALTAAAGSMTRGDILLFTFAGHGSFMTDQDGDDRSGSDQTWCLYDGEIVDDQMAGYWQLFQPGVRILVVADGCHSAGNCRDDKGALSTDYASPTGYASRRRRVMRGEAPVYRSGSRSAGPPDYTGSCIGAPPLDTDGIHASLLLLAAAREHEKAQEGLFTRHLLEVWDGGNFPGTFCDLYREMRERVVTELPNRQEPQILMLGSPDPGFPLERAFHLERGSRGRGYR